MASVEEVVKANEAFKRILDELIVYVPVENDSKLIADIRLVGNFIEAQLVFEN
jgi:hypothetical protein